MNRSKTLRILLSLFLLFIAAGIMVVNFGLIAASMSKMVGGSESVGGFRIADIAALNIVLVELSMGLFILATVRRTQFMPILWTLPANNRKQMACMSALLLILLSGIEAGLIYLETILEMAESTMAFSATTAAEMTFAFLAPYTSLLFAYALHSLLNVSRGGGNAPGQAFE